MKEEFADLINDFKEESFELLNAMEEQLLDIQQQGMNDENINAVFRAAHTIKGSAGMFELDYLVKFTHIAENLLDEIRKKRIALNDQILNTYFEVKDQMQALVSWALSNETAPSGALDDNSKRLAEELNCYLNGTAVATVKVEEAKVEIPENTPTQEAPEQPEQASQVSCGVFMAEEIEQDVNLDYKIVLNFYSTAVTNGIDPMEYVKKLRMLGSVINLRSELSETPDILQFAAAPSSIMFIIDYRTNNSKETLQKVFEPIKEHCSIEIECLSERQAVVVNQPPVYVPNQISMIEPPKEIVVQQVVEPEQKPSVQKVEPAAKQESPTPKPAVQIPAQDQKAFATLRVEAHKIDTLINLIGEMVIANSNVVQQIATRGDKELMESISAVSRMLEDLREASMQTRMVPIVETFSRFKRIVRDLSKDLGKDIELEIVGGETELDKTVTEKIYDPLIHLVRNSLDHGIELPSARHEKGKSTTGHLTLKAFHEAGSIAIQIVDDGKGLDPALLKAKAIEKGLIDADAEISDKEAYGLIMLPGFSTAEKISNISGRGVGMDVVKRNIEELRGTIELDSKLGIGTTITIRLPLTLAIIDGFLTKVGDTFYVVPLDMIVECIELTKKQILEMSDNNYINLRGSILPLLDLREFFEINKVHSKRENIVIVRFAEQTLGIIVNELHGEFQTVIKPIGPVFKNVRGIGGATILGSGEVAMILDIPILLQSVNKINTHTENTRED